MQYTDLFTHKASIELVRNVLMIRKKKHSLRWEMKIAERTDSDAVAVVGDLNELEAAVFYDDIYGRGVGVEAVLDELLHGGDRPLDDLSGGDAVDDRLV